MENAIANSQTVSRSRGHAKFIVGGLLIVGAVLYLVVTSTQNSVQYFYTIEEIQTAGDTLAGKNLRVSGAVLGETIQYDAQTLKVAFTMANVSNDTQDIEAVGGLAAALHAAVLDPNIPHLKVVYIGPRPDLLKNESQAIVTGRLGTDGIFYAEELLLKCPSRYDDQLLIQTPGAGN